MPSHVCQILRQLDNTFGFYGSSCNCVKRGFKKKKKLSEFLQACISGMAEVIFFKLGTSVVFHRTLASPQQFDLVQTKVHGAMNRPKFVHCSSWYTHDVCAPHILGLHDTQPCVLILAELLGCGTFQAVPYSSGEYHTVQ